ncbi:MULTISPECIES: twin-arginine translocase TatA/TatE family subunit [unclassified Mesorhizobium]|uniref:twin-arginine translocase TatA/TatE family subunit n=1 Tax=unclassified Mesorhizobium TaxID=325217 RepID=UPI0004844717|nr:MULTISPECIES: twin-arginine translocase TatA/TatE family subunit [unclassified Mesorhizobium]PBC21263.1 twin-arginine translocase TatA/TatE family subunit [Mesorhizobium sp. WSM4311]RWO70178.1 MAG: twin-arginine translocase TatA/TatE family subunit [Mesorhizobium sp.]TRD04807.1 twin-arginine translocase TatA/TatE family subunit [Mesorhizobium sp. WSM4305]
MGALSIWHWLLVIVVVMIFFGRGRISALMGDVGKGIRNLRQELTATDDAVPLAREPEARGLARGNSSTKTSQRLPGQ